MIKDIIEYCGKRYQLSTINLNGVFETMIFPVEDGVVSGKEVYCFRTCKAGESKNKHADIYYNNAKYLSEQAIDDYLRSKEYEHNHVHSENTIYNLTTEPKRDDGVYVQVFAVRDGIRYDIKVISLKEVSISLTNSLMDGVEKVFSV